MLGYPDFPVGKVLSEDLISSVEVTKSIACNRNRSMAVRVFYLQKYVELVTPDYEESPIYNVLLSVIHDRKNVAAINNKENLSEDAFALGMAELADYLDGLSYNEVLDKVNSKRLLELAVSSDGYERIIAGRLLVERYDELIDRLHSN